MTVTIVESGMTFGPFPDEHCFHIEKSAIYETIQNGMQIAEFLLIQPDKNALLVVEAKQSAPNPMNPESKENFDIYVTEIAEKLSNAFSLGLALCLNRHVNNQNEVSDCFKQISHNAVKVKLILVINGHQDSWLAPVNEALQKKLKCISKIWPLDVITINEKIAQRYNLVQATA